MIGEISAWYGGRSRREQLMLLLMLAIAVPVLAWLLVVRPLSAAYDRALVDHLEAVDRHGRVLSLTVASPRPVRGGQSGGDLQLLVTQTSGQAGIALERVVPAGPNTVEVSGTGARAPSATQWLQQLESRGVSAEQLTMTPLPDGSINLSVRLTR